MVVKVYPVAASAVMLMVISFIARWWNLRSLSKVQYRRKFHYRRGFPGEEVPVQLEVENNKLLPVSWLRILDLWPFAVGPKDEAILEKTHSPELGNMVNLFSLRWFERTRRGYQLLLRKRGVYALGPVQLESGDMFGLFEQVRKEEPGDTITVFPQPLPFEALRLPTDDPFGDRRARRRLYEDPNQPMGVRDYHPEDDFRHVHWPATAHTSSLQVKVYQPVSAQVMVVCLNASTLPHYWEGTYPALLEHLIQVTATLVERGLKDGYRVGLISNGCLAHSDQPFRVPPGRSPEQLAHLLSALAGVTPIVTGPFDRFLMTQVSRLPYGATLAIVTGLLPPVLVETILSLRHHGRRITLFSFAQNPPPAIPGVQSVHLPFSE